MDTQNTNAVRIQRLARVTVDFSALSQKHRGSQFPDLTFGRRWLMQRRGFYALLLLIGLVVGGLIAFVDVPSLPYQHLLSPITSIAVNAVTEDVPSHITPKQQSAAMGSQRRCNVLKFEHNAGQWIKTNFSRDVTWPCCGMDTSFRKYPDQCGTSPCHAVPSFRTLGIVSFMLMLEATDVREHATLTPQLVLLSQLNGHRTTVHCHCSMLLISVLMFCGTDRCWWLATALWCKLHRC